MNDDHSLRRWLVQAAVVLLGFAVTVVVVFQIQRDEAAAERSVRARFQELPASEKSIMLEKARLLSQSPAELQRLKSIHNAVTAEPELQSTLQTFGQWWQNLGRDERATLRSNGSFVENWPAQTHDLFIETQQKGQQIEKEFPPWAQLPTVAFTQHDFEQFLDAVIGAPLPASLNEQLSELDETAHRCEFTLAKTVWLVNQLLDDLRDRRADTASRLESEKLRQATFDYLLQTSTRDDNRVLRSRLTDLGSNDVRGRYTILFLVKEALDHYSDSFQSRHLENQRQQLVKAFAAEDRDEQLQLMRMSPEEAQAALSNRLILERPTLDPGIARLADRIEQLRERYSRHFRRGRPSSRSEERPRPSSRPGDQGRPDEKGRPGEVRRPDGPRPAPGRSEPSRRGPGPPRPQTRP